MHTFKVKTTRYTVTTPERQLEIEAYCAKIKSNTGRSRRATNKKPVYPQCYGGESAAQYVRKYERLNDFRLGHHTRSESLFGELSDNPQWPQTDPVIEEPLSD